MEASDLKNTPWTAKKIKDYPLGWEVKDCVGWTMSTMIDEPTAKAIADLPDTLKELQAVKAELERKRRKEECLVRSRDLWIRAFNKQKNDLKQAQAELDELRAFVKEVKNLSGRKTFPTEKELQETYNQAKKLLNSK